MSASALVFGAGRVACGLLGDVLARSGYATTFVARRREVVETISAHEGYALAVGGAPARTFVPASGALDVADAAAVVRAITLADVVFTAVGAESLASIAPLLAAGLAARARARRREPLPVIACENLPGAGSYLEQIILAAADASAVLAIRHVARFSSALTRRIIARAELEDGILVVSADGAVDLLIDAVPLPDVTPAIRGASYTRSFAAAVMRKLFTLNAAQAIAAYLGHERGLELVPAAIAVPAILRTVRGAVAQSSLALAAAFPDDREVIRRDAADALERVANHGLADAIRRVAKDPRRKLAARERLVGPARLAHRQGLPHDALVTGIVAALRYDDPADEQASAMQRDIALWGVDRVLTEDCGLLPHDELARAVKRAWGEARLELVA